MQRDRPSEAIAKRLEREARKIRYEAAFVGFIKRDVMLRDADVMDRAAKIAREGQ
jgi:hypothetical protein